MLFTPFFQAWARRSPSRLFCTLSNLLKSKGSSQKCWYPCESSSALGGGSPGTIPQLPAALCRTRRYGNGLWLHKGGLWSGFCHRPLESPPLHAFQHRRKVSSREGNGFPKSGNPCEKCLWTAVQRRFNLVLCTLFRCQLFCPLPVCFKKAWGLPQHPEKVFVRVQPGFLSRLNQAVNHGAGLGSRRGVGKQPVFPAYHKGLYAALGAVVGDFQPAVLQVADKITELTGTTCEKAQERKAVHPG